jgi:hypothetical protein
MRSPKTWGPCSLFLLLFGLAAPPAAAQTTGFGLGAVINDPTGISLKFWTNSSQAVAGAATFNVSDGGSYLLLQGDYLFHQSNDLDVEDGHLAFYYGPGVRFIFFEDNDPFFEDNNDLGFALRAPLGLVYMFSSSPVDVFVELIPTLTIEPTESFGFEGALGFRYFFN